MTLADLLSKGEVLHLPAHISHVRTGPLRRAFRYRADYLLFAPEVFVKGRGLLQRNRFGLYALYDKDHGRQSQSGLPWSILETVGFARKDGQVLALLTQPRFLGFIFNPVSFWLLYENSNLRALIAEVNNPWGERHSYLCVPPLGTAITPQTRLEVEKIFYVSPFQDVVGKYHFRLALSEDRVDILICHKGVQAGLVARLQGPLLPITQSRLFKTALLRPGGALRVLALIYWQAIKLKLAGARWRNRPTLPSKDFSQ